MRVIHCAYERFLLELAACLSDRRRRQELFVEFVAILEPSRRHSLGRTHCSSGVLWVWDVEGPGFAAQKTRGGERLQLFAFPKIEALTNVDEGWDCRIEGSECARDECTEMRAVHTLRRRVARVPLELVPRVQNESEIACGVTTDECSPIHDRSHLFQTRGKLDAIHRGIDGREG